MYLSASDELAKNVKIYAAFRFDMQSYDQFNRDMQAILKKFNVNANL